ncbi:MAG: hypothetical protein ACTSYE_07495 [Alphaproteobacteria bacterium]
MDTEIIGRILRDKLRDSETYWIAAIVGTLINGYGQLLVPWFRGAASPFVAARDEFAVNPGLMIFSIILAYVFPLVVGVTSSVLTRYRGRRIESVADFPDRKPDPVFRAAQDGSLVEVGESTQQLFAKHRIESAQSILGENLWTEILAARAPGGGRVIYFRPENREYVVSFAPTAHDHVNIYMTPLPSH